MPNFKAKKLHNLDLPKSYEGVEFRFSTLKQLGKILVYTKIKDSSFFIEINEKNDEFVIKIDKLTKITNLALMQKALEIFEKYFCDEIISRAYNYNQNKELASNIISNVLEFKSVISNYQNVFLEIGFGSGRHLLYQAKNNPNNIYIGIEIHKPSLIQVSKLAKDLNNVYLLDFDARIAIKELSENSLNGVYLHFPVPWDDAPSRRVVSSDFRSEILRVLKIDGFFELRSDSLMYANYTESIFANEDYDLYKNQNAKIVSKYEDRWLRMNKDIYDLIVYKRNAVNVANKALSENIKFIIDFKKLDFIKYIGDDFFVKISRIYELNNAKLVCVCYGAFSTPSTSYLLCENDKEFEFLFFDFCSNAQNIKAFCKLKEFLQ